MNILAAKSKSLRKKLFLAAQSDPELKAIMLRLKGAKDLNRAGEGEISQYLMGIILAFSKTCGQSRVSALEEGKTLPGRKTAFIINLLENFVDRGDIKEYLQLLNETERAH